MLRFGEKQGKTVQESRQTNGHDVIIHVVDVLYNLLNSGNFIGVLVFFVILLMFLIAWKLPPESLETHLSTILIFLENEKFYFFPLGTALLISLIGNHVQRKIYKTEIKRLVAERKFLMHGKNGDLKTLEIHHPSRFDLEE